MENIAKIMMLENAYLSQLSESLKYYIMIPRGEEEDLKRALQYKEWFSEEEKDLTEIEYNLHGLFVIKINEDTFNKCRCIIEKIKIQRELSLEENVNSGKRRRIWFWCMHKN